MDHETAECPYLRSHLKRERELPMGFLSSLYRSLDYYLGRDIWRRNFELYDVAFTIQADGLIVVEIVFYNPLPKDWKEWKITKAWRKQIRNLAEQLLGRTMRLVLSRAKKFGVDEIAVALRYENPLVKVYRYRVERQENKRAR